MDSQAQTARARRRSDDGRPRPEWSETLIGDDARARFHGAARVSAPGR